MRIPMTPIQAAGIAAVPQQANREARSSSSATTDPGSIELKTNETLEKSVETGDRDAQEQYQGKARGSSKKDDQNSDSGQTASDKADSIWSLSVADDQPLPDLDIRG